uniref:homologous-pairing protein 2 homolog isoform X1 n=1 Tax=Callithrix jacchus TaxID=9483 RepID=UPI0023DD14DD|nr:homologous-pairing protein 2 homolog isoform X1 [Callithrix jacchus]
MRKFSPEMNYGVRQRSPCSPEGFLFSQSLLEARPHSRKEPSPRATTTSGFLSWVAGKAMSKGRAEAAAGAVGILLRYLQEQNRPYSAQDVFGNLQREHGLGKAVVVKTLEQLAQQGKIKEKMYGKQKIYFADQDQFDMVSDADLRGLDAKIVALTAKVQSLQQSCRYMEAELKELSSALTTPEMQKEIQALKKECAGYRERLKNIKAATNHVTPEEKEQVYRERQKYCKEWRKRKRMPLTNAAHLKRRGFISRQATELSDAILEGYPKSKKQFFEEVGIETDEDCNVTLPDP